MNFVRPTWQEDHMTSAIKASLRSTCLVRRCGAALVRGNRVIATGYNGAPPDVESCLHTGFCFYQGLAYQASKQTGRPYEELKEEKKQFCNAAHAEKNVFNQCSDLGVSAHGGVLFITNFPCPGCVRDNILPNFVRQIFIWKDYLSNPLISMDEKDIAMYWLKQAKVTVTKVNISEERISELCKEYFVAGDRMPEYQFHPDQLVQLAVKPNFS